MINNLDNSLRFILNPFCFIYSLLYGADVSALQDCKMNIATVYVPMFLRIPPPTVHLVQSLFSDCIICAAVIL